MAVLRNLVYAQTMPQPGKPARTLALDLYLPTPASTPSPVILWIHGGAWRTGDKGFPPAALPLVKDGYAVASIGYRFSQHALFPAQIRDVKAAVRWLRLHAADYNLDPLRFAAWGPSAGGHLAALLGVSYYMRSWEVGDYEDCAPPEISSMVQAVVDWFGPTDLLRMDDQPGEFSHNAPDSPESLLIGAPIQAEPEKAAAANPIRYITPACPPFLICHGQEDRTVLPAQSRLLHEALQKSRGITQLDLLSGEGHGFSPPMTAWAVEQARVFLGSSLKPPQLAYYALTKNTFRPRSRHAVRWLSPHQDYPLARDYWLTCPSAGQDILTQDDWQQAHELGTSYAAVTSGEGEHERILSIAAVVRYSEVAWEVGDVSTADPAFRRQGLGTSACSFVAQYILGSGRIATLTTSLDNRPLHQTAEKIGFVRVG